MRPLFSLSRTVVFTIVCVFGIIFMGVMGLGYQMGARTLTIHMKPEQVKDAARSCFICATAYVICTLILCWQIFLHWRYSSSTSGSVWWRGQRADITSTASAVPAPATPAWKELKQA